MSAGDGGGGRGHVHARERDRDRDRAPSPAASREAPAQPETATAPMTPISFAKAFNWGAAGGATPTPPPAPPPSPLGRPVAAPGSAPERAADAAEARQRGAPDLTGVRVHTDARADGYARSLGAEALTLGQDIFVARAAWNPGSAATHALLAHELHHAHHGQAGVVYRKTNDSTPSSPAPGTATSTSNAGSSPPEPDLLARALTLAVEYRDYFPEKMQRALDVAVKLESYRQFAMSLERRVESKALKEVKCIPAYLADKITEYTSPAFAATVNPFVIGIGDGLIDSVPGIVWSLVRDAILPAWGVLMEDLPAFWRGFLRITDGLLHLSFSDVALGFSDQVTAVMSAAGRFMWAVTIWSGAASLVAGTAIGGGLGGAATAPAGGEGAVPGGATGAAAGGGVASLIQLLGGEFVVASLANDIGNIAIRAGRIRFSDETDEQRIEDAGQIIAVASRIVVTLMFVLIALAARRLAEEARKVAAKVVGGGKAGPTLLAAARLIQRVLGKPKPTPVAAAAGAPPSEPQAGHGPAELKSSPAPEPVPAPAEMPKAPPAPNSLTLGVETAPEWSTVQPAPETPNLVVTGAEPPAGTGSVPATEGTSPPNAKVTAPPAPDAPGPAEPGKTAATSGAAGRLGPRRTLTPAETKPMLGQNHGRDLKMAGLRASVSACSRRRRDRTVRCGIL